MLILFPGSILLAGPKHSTSVPFSAGFAVPLSVDEKEVALVPNPVPVVTVKGLPDPQELGSSAVLCTREHSLLPFTLQMVIPSLSPVTVHLKVKVPPGQVGGGAVSCPATTPGNRPMKGNISSSMYTQLAGFYTGIEGNYARISLLRQEELSAIYVLNRARATHCRATQSVFTLILEQNRAAMAERLLDTHKTNFENKLWQTGKFFFKNSSCGSVATSHK